MQKLYSTQFLKKKLFFIFILCTSSTLFSQTFSDNGINYTVTSATIPLTVEVASYNDFYGDAIIPSTVTNASKNYSVTSIGNLAFYTCFGLTSVTIPDSVTSIGHDAFAGCTGLTSVTIPDSVTSIGYVAFLGCTGLTSVTMPNSLATIEYGIFKDCNLLASVTIPSSVTNIEDFAFFGCSSLASVVIPNSVTSIGEYVFSNCYSLLSVTMPNYLSSIGIGAFYGCSSLTAITIPESVTSIKDSTFVGCSGLTSILIPNSVTSIGFFVFGDCTSLTSVSIPSSVTSIGNYAFQSCTGLTSFTVDWATPLAIPNEVFSNVNLANVILYVPAGTQSAYLAAPVWQNFGMVTLGTQDFLNNNNFETYPNPATNNVTIDLLETDNSDLEVFDFNGKKLLTQKLSNLSNNINIENLVSGVYIFQVSSNKGSATRKVIKQ